ncbi:MAG: trehalose-6-phosphate synthase, partial [Candidatus Omnitrophota bacterium]
MWTKENLEQLAKDKMKDYLFVVVSNREPYVHVFQKNNIKCQRGVGGVTSALDPVMRACGGTWVAYGQGDADQKMSDEKGRLKVPPENPSYTLRRVWLNKQEELGFYYGYSNSFLWPLCHVAFHRPSFTQEDWEYYKQVNEKFARAVIEEIGNQKAFIWIQDYHFCLLAQYLKQSALSKQIITALFWHIPWPNHEVFRLCPQKKEILEGLLANDLLGFHLRYHCYNFLDAVDREIESKIDRERFSVTRNDHETLVRPYPISVDFADITAKAQSNEVQEMQQALVEEYKLSGMKVLIGLDRIDYTKGLPEKFLAVDALLERHPELREKIVLLQIGVISRLHLKSYKNLNDEINALLENINWKYSTGNWKPIILTRQHFSLPQLLALYRISDVGLISSLHDGMNLVAKEYISSRTDAGDARV